MPSSSISLAQCFSFYFSNFRVRVVVFLLLSFLVCIRSLYPTAGWLSAQPGDEQKLECTTNYVENTMNDPAYPPTYDLVRQRESNLPQHNLDLPYPEGRTGRYVLFTNQIRLLGWNNALNEVLMNAHLAYKSKRAYVFQDYYWMADYYPWPRYLFRENRPTTPLTALLSGPAAGGPWEEGDDTPRSITEIHFPLVCPENECRHVNITEMKDPVRWSDGQEIFDYWEKFLLEAPERCIVVNTVPIEVDGHPQIFDLWLWGSNRILSLWESFSKSPVSRLVQTSPIVNSAVARNEHLFLPRGDRASAYVLDNIYDRILAVHLRRGDYSDACVGLANWNSTFYSWNLLPDLIDSFTPPPGGVLGENTPENIEMYMKRCMPGEDSIIKKIRDARDEYQRATKNTHKQLDTLYVLTNDQSSWLPALKKRLMAEGWKTVVTSQELQLDAEQKDVSMAVDMDIARRAAVFVGNGWSSLTSNIVHRRLVDGKEYISIRFY